jgi:hypothetical protein
VEVKKKKEPHPKPVYTKKQKKWAKEFLTTLPQFRLNQLDDYGREFARQESLLKEKILTDEKDLPNKKMTSKKCGKQVSQVGAQSKQSIPRS